MTNLNYIDINYDATFTKVDDSTDLGTVSINKTVYIDPTSEAPVKKLFSRYILDGNTFNYNEYQPDAITSKNNIRIGRVWPVSNLSHFLVNDNNYFFCNSNNKINAYTNTGVLYYTTEKDYIDIENVIIGVGNNIYIKYDVNKLDCLIVLGNMLDIAWTIINDDFGSQITSDDNYLYINSKENETIIYVVDPRLADTENYIVRTITIDGFDEDHIVDTPNYIVKLDLFTDDILYNFLANDKFTKVTSNLFMIDNITYLAKHNVLYKMELDKDIENMKIFTDKCDIVKIDKIDDNRLFVMTNDNRVAIIDISGEYSNDLGLIIFTYDDSENTDKILLDVEIDKKDKNFYFIYSNSIEKVYPSLVISPYGIIGSPCYKFDGGSSYIEFRTMPMNNNNFSTSVSFKPTKINNSKSVLFGGGDNYNWSSICWSDYLNIFCAITKNDNITSIMPDDGSENWYTTNTRTLPIADWNSICWDNVYNLFYTISTDNKFAYSSDGLHWILIDNIPNSGLWNKVYYAEVINNTYILQKNSNKLLYAMNVNSTWREITLPIVSDWKDIVYRNSDKMLVLVNGTNKIYTVKRHSVFNSIVVGENANWTNVCYSKELDLFVLIAKNSNDIAYSSDGLIWTLRKLPYADSWSTIIYDEFNFNRFFIFANDSNKYISSSNLIDWKIVDNELNQNYNITSVSAGNKMICALINDADLSLKIMSGSDIIINNKYQKTLTNVFNRNVTKSTFQLYFDGNDNFMYVLYGNYKFKCYFKIDSSKIDNWYNITTIVNNNKIKVYSNSTLIGNFDIDDDIGVYNYTMNDIENDKYYFIMPDYDTFSNIYTFRIGNSVFNNNHNNSLYGYVNDFILFNYIITEKEIDEISKIKVLHCRFNYDFKDPIYKNIIHDISCYKHDLTGTADYSSNEEAFKFDDYVNLNVAKNNFYFINDKFTLSFWYKNEIDNNLGSKILMSNYKNKDPYMLLLADQFKPTTDLPIQLVQSKYEVREMSLLLETNKWVNNDGYYDYIVSNEHVDENTVIDILPNIYISDYEFDSLLETDLMGYSQSEGTFTLRCYGIKPSIDIPVRVLIRTWVPTSMSLQYITLSANNWNNNLYTVYIPGIKNTDTIEMIIDNEPTYKQYNAIMAADLKGYSQSNNSFIIKANGIIPNIDIPILFYINSNEAKISETVLDRNYWLGTETPFNYRITLDDPNDNFVNILPSNYISSEELNILKTAGIRDGGIFGTEISGWMITYMPTEEDPEKYSIYFVMIEGNGRITKVNCVKDDATINYENWNNFVISYNNGIFNTYINGIPQRVENYKNYIDSSNLIIGANPNMINLANIGMVYGSYYMKDVRVFHEALNNNYIQELVNRGNMLNSSGALYTEKISENYDNVDISKEGLKVKNITEYTDTDPDSVYDYDILINLQHGINSNEVLLKDEIIEKL